MNPLHYSLDTYPMYPFLLNPHHTVTFQGIEWPYSVLKAQCPNAMYAIEKSLLVIKDFWLRKIAELFKVAH